MALDSTVKVKFLGDAANLAREAARASKATDQVGRSAENAHTHLMRMAKGIAVGAALGTAVAGVEKFAHSSVNAFKDAAAEASKLNRLTGLTAEQSSRLGFAAKETGQDSENFAKSLGILAKNLAGADKAQTVLTKSHHLAIQQVPKLVKGHLEYAFQLKTVTDVQKKTVAGTQSLGFALRDASGHLLPMSKLLPEIADKFKGMANGPEKTALALKLFGRGGAQLLPFLNQGAAGLAKFGEEADKLGITMSGKDVTSYRQYVAAQREFHAAMEGVKITLGREMFPLFTLWGQAVADHAPQINTLAREYVGKLVPAVQRLTDWVKRLMKGFKDGTGEGGKLRDAMKTTADAAKRLGDVLIPIVRFLAEHPRVFFTLAAGVGAFKAVAGVAAFRASALGVALFGVAGGEAAATDAAPAAEGAMVSLGAAAKTALGEITLAVAAAYGAYKLGKYILAGLNKDSARLGTPTAGIDLPPQNPVIDFNGKKYAANGSGLVPDLPPLHPQKPRTPDPHEHGAPTPAQNDARNKDITSGHKAAQDQAAKAAADQQAAADKQNTDALAAQEKQAAAAQKAADAKQAAADALQKASDAMKQALTDRLETAKSIRDSLVSSNSVVRDGLSWTAKDLLSRFRTQMDKVRRFSAALQDMVRKGYSATIVRQVADAGVQGGMGTAVGLAHASAGQVAQFNAVQSGIDRYASSAGGAVAGQMGPIQLVTKVMLNDRELATAVNNWNRQAAATGHR